VETKTITPIRRVATIPITHVRSISNWNELHTFAFTIINSFLNNSVISHVQFLNTSNEAWQKLIMLFESQDAITPFQNTTYKLHSC
jgi:hypothetical protein